MRRIFIGTLVVLTIALINGCANRKITRVDPNETIDLSGRWNDSDSRLVSEEMIGDLLTSAWIPRSRNTRTSHSAVSAAERWSDYIPHNSGRNRNIPPSPSESGESPVEKWRHRSEFSW